LAPDVTVVVPTYERGPIVARSLDALGRVESPAGGYEVIVVDDGSSPAHAALVKRTVAAMPEARLLRQANAGPAVARNAGYREGTGALVAFLDDDCAPARDWLVQLVAAFEREPGLAAVGGRVLPAPPTNWVSRFCAATEYSSGVPVTFENAATANACYRREVLDELGGFDERFVHPGGDDPDLSARARAAGHTLRFVPEAVVYHSEFERPAEFVRSMYNRGLGEALLVRKHGGAAKAAARALLLPVFLARTSIGVWRRTAGKGGRTSRLGWLVFEAIGRVAFVAGSVRGLAGRA
jgi:GT2 family glycosyltransferase